MTRSSWLAVAAVALLSLGCARGQVDTAVAGAGDGMDATRTVYLGTFGRTPDAQTAREQMRLALIEQGRFTVVETESAADAVIRGDVVLRRGSSGRLRDAQVFGELRLLRARSGRLLWQGRYEPRDIEPISNETPPSTLIHRLVLQLSEELHRAAGPT